ncbi:MAG TPA: rhomboid family intramembrane serine protease [Bacteroidota bacterium]
MIPLRDHNPTRKRPYVNFGLVLVNILVFLYEVSLGSGVEPVYYKLGVVPRDVMSAFAEYRYVEGIIPFVTLMFLHGGWLHLGGNMLYLWIFGDNVEDKLGHTRYFVFYALCGLAAGILHVVLDPSSGIPTVGASGAISGVLGAYLVMFPRAKVLTLIPVFVFLQVAELPALLVLGFWFVIQFFNGLVSLGYETAGMGGVAWWAHIGGFLAGLLLILPLRKYR